MSDNRFVVAGRIVATGATLLLVLAAAIGCSQEEVSRVGDDRPTDRFVVGDVIQIGDLRLTVHGVTDPVRPLDQRTSVGPNKRWVAVDVEVQNISTESVSVSSVVQFAVQDARNEQYSALDPDGNDGFPDIDGDLAAGGSRRGTILFEVNRDADQLRLFFAGDPLASGSVQVALS